MDTKNLFSEKSETYAKYRPGYPNELIDKMFSSLNKGDDIVTADIGAGTGISTRLLAEKGARVFAIEPNNAMIEAAREHPGITFIRAQAENTTLSNSSVDMVTSFQAFHWFHFNKSLKEFNRILRPDGLLALVWSYWDEDDSFTNKYHKLILDATNRNVAHVSPYDGFPGGYIKKWKIRFLWKFRTMPYFKKVKRYRFGYEQKMDTEALIGCAHSQSYIDHNGSDWKILCEKIENLSAQTENTNLVYKVNLFLGRPF